LIRRLQSFLSASSLGVRVGSTIVVALLPLGVLSVVQTKAAQDQVDAAALDGVAGAALNAVRSQIDLIAEAQISARVLGSMLSQSMNDGTACVERVTAVARQIPQATLVAYIPLSGLMTCSSNGRVYDFKADASFQHLIAQPLPQIIYNPRGPVSGTAVIGVSQPVFDARGAQTGIVAISLAYTSVAPDAYVDAVARWRSSYLATFLADGTLLLSSDPKLRLQDAIPGKFDPAQLPILADRPAYLNDADGPHILSVARLPHDLFLLSVWQRDADPLLGRFADTAPYLLPLFTWIAALTAAAFASSRLVVRHVRALSRSMSNYVSTRQRLTIPEMRDAPAEIQRLHAAYEGMIRTIEQEEADLQNLLVDKDQLLREVSHRSGNSLQIIASIMRTYRRESSDSNIKQVLDSLINRVITLSSTHTSLYAVSGQRDVAIDVVLSNVVKRLKEIHGVGLGVAAKRLQPIQMESQAAVPLALALAEAVGCFFARPGLAKEAVTVSLSEVDGIVHLGIQGPDVPELRPEALQGLVALPQRMLHQFAAQLSGNVRIRLVEDQATVDLTFPRPGSRDGT
jgi:two-component system, sensor histidine kinase PdtaS